MLNEWMSYIMYKNQISFYYIHKHWSIWQWEVAFISQPLTLFFLELRCATTFTVHKNWVISHDVRVRKLVLYVKTRHCFYDWSNQIGQKVWVDRRSYLVPTHLGPTHLVSRFAIFYCYLLIIYYKYERLLQTFIKENKYLENGNGFIRIRPIYSLRVIGLEVFGLNVYSDFISFYKHIVRQLYKFNH